MIPQKSDPKWDRFLVNLPQLQAGNLATKMLINRLKLKVSFDQSAISKKEAIETAYEFFSKNETAVADDIKTISA